MNMVPTLLLACMLTLGMADTLAQPAPGQPESTPGAMQHAPTARIRGTITAFDNHVLRLTTGDGTQVSLSLPDDTKISVLSPLRLQDIKQGSFVGVTALPRGPASTLEALEVHAFPESMRGTGEGHYEWDLRPGSTMTNANVDAVVKTRNGRTLILGYKGGSQKIVVPKGVPIVTFTEADKSLLMPGAQVLVIARPAADGSMIALRILVGKNGMKPPM